MDANKIQVIDDDGNELEFDVLFTFDNDDTKKSYVLYYDSTVEEPQVYSSIYDEEGHLFPIETPEEWEMVEEVFGSFMADDEDEQEGCCHNGDNDHECCHDHDEDHECCHDHDEDHECCHDGEEEHECCCHKKEG